MLICYAIVSYVVGLLVFMLQPLWQTQWDNGDKCFSFVICNEGYTVDRYIHRRNERYNVQPWDYARIPEVFGANEKYEGYPHQNEK
ncbi:uncharacterized protein N7496_005719 [Penicillium cataractarum]|uniref:Uncharacterized protein n=1 Tax=Penicillium cataractarum TaxID=2100454 RepID=A0A9W9VG59_9EURO|nr:uncharacterized protein N7496_005719 [Penicillium cataractarum]KAJ5378310.1 hypothetical protein N7496_005719 [Penicillium cataractarum]